MLFFEKSQPGPSCLTLEKAKASGSYNLPEVLEQLKQDFRNKCYICEQKEPLSIEIEHFRPHKGDVDLKFDWNNLFWSCRHCNAIKSAQFNNIIDCTSPTENIQSRLKLTLDPMPKELVKIEALDDLDETIETMALLEQVYNGTTVQKTIESSHLRRRIQKVLISFYTLLHDYDQLEDNTEDKQHYRNEIVIKLRKSSEFASFKRSIVMMYEHSRVEFEKDFD
jgi:uncharacterized protein (TIGR02646 family)